MLQNFKRSISRYINISNRYRIHFFSNIIPYNKRCDPQSQCAQSARKLLSVLRAFHSRNPTMELYDDNVAAVHAKRVVMEILDLCMEPETETETYHQVEGGAMNQLRYYSKDRFLSTYKCNILALMILEEAILQFEDFNKYEMGSTGSSVVETMLMGSLETLIQELKSSDYKSKIDVEVLDERLQLFQLKFKGEGIEFLKRLSKAKNPNYCEL